jgi:hypothetical protein
MSETASSFFFKNREFFPFLVRGQLPVAAFPSGETVRRWLTFRIGQRKEGAGAGWRAIRRTESIPFEPRSERNEFRSTVEP